MSEQVIFKPLASEGTSMAGDEGDVRYCPECGQSLNLARPEGAPVQRRTPEPFVLLIFGLCLVVVFGLRVWNTHQQFTSLDQQIASLRARPLTSEVGDLLGEVLADQLSTQLAFDRDVTGLGLGLLTLVVGAVSWLQERPEPVDRKRKWMGPQRLPALDRSQVAGSPCYLVGLVATTLARMLLVMLITNLGLQLLRGVPPSPQLVDQSLTRIIDLLLTLAGLVS